MAKRNAPPTILFTCIPAHVLVLIPTGNQYGQTTTNKLRTTCRLTAISCHTNHRQPPATSATELPDLIPL
eukprot:12934425-Prorocentrum_lima.AAC.1